MLNNTHQVLGSLRGVLAERFAKLFELRFSRRCSLRPVPSGADLVEILIPISWPKNERERIKHFFEGFRLCTVVYGENNPVACHCHETYPQLTQHGKVNHGPGCPKYVPSERAVLNGH